MVGPSDVGSVVVYSSGSGSVIGEMIGYQGEPKALIRSHLGPAPVGVPVASVKLATPDEAAAYWRGRAWKAEDALTERGTKA